MKNLKLLIILSIFCLFPIIVNASDNGIFEAASESELKKCLETEAFCKLKSDINVKNELTIDKEVLIDLNGKTLKPADTLELHRGFILINRGGKLIVKDSLGTGKISTGSKENSKVWAAIQLAHDNNTDKLAELVVNGVTIEGYYYGIVGNGNYDNTKITINGGTIIGLNEEDSVGIYHPQEGELDILGGTIKGGTGIEIRSGNLNVSNGTIEGVSPRFIKVVNANGSTTNGVGIAVAQHTTKKDIKVNISGGNISGQYAFYEWNPHGNNKADIDKVVIKITGGEFTGTAEGVPTVYSEDFTKFISGGKFNKSVSKYLTDDAQVTSKEIEEIKTDENEKTNKTSRTWIIIIAFIVIGGLVGYILIKKGYSRKIISLG